MLTFAKRYVRQIYHLSINAMNSNAFITVANYLCVKETISFLPCVHQLIKQPCNTLYLAFEEKFQLNLEFQFNFVLSNECYRNGFRRKYPRT